MARVKRKTVQRAAATSSKLKYHIKRPGFNGFGAHSLPRRKNNVLQLARCKEVEPPETGIHSFEWANAIVPQNSRILKLPVEVRHQIWNLVISNFSCADGPITPMKKGNIFYSPNWTLAPQETIALAETCRQMYVDFVGGGLLYRTKQFSFTPTLMLNYLWVINPIHKNCLQSIQLCIKVRDSSKLTFPKKAITTLAGLSNLLDLTLEFELSAPLCYRVIRIRPYNHNLMPLHLGREVPWSVLAKIRSFAGGLKEIKGLRSFQLRFTTFDRYNAGVNCFGRNFYEYGLTLLSDTKSGPYHDLQEELQEILIRRALD